MTAQQDLVLADRLEDLVHQKRTETGATLSEIATAIGISDVALGNYMGNNKKGPQMPGGLAVKKLCTYFGVSADWLLGLTDIQTISLETKDIVCKTGLSEEAIEKLCDIKAIGSPMYDYALQGIDYMVLSNRFLAAAGNYMTLYNELSRLSDIQYADILEGIEDEDDVTKIERMLKITEKAEKELYDIAGTPFKVMDAGTLVEYIEYKTRLVFSEAIDSLIKKAYKDNPVPYFEYRFHEVDY